MKTFIFPFCPTRLLKWIEARPVEDPYILIGQFLAVIYFDYYLINSLTPNEESPLCIGWTYGENFNHVIETSNVFLIISTLIYEKDISTAIQIHVL